MFVHECGVEVISKVTKMKGIITSRSENLYGCNRYYVQPPIGKDNKMPDGWWHDEQDLEVVGLGVTAKKKKTGGPISKIQ